MLLRAFLNYLRDFKFECDVWAVPEGTPVFPGEPLVTVAGPMIQAQFVETMVLLTVNHQTLIATKANRITRAAQGRTVLEFGSRRAQGYDGAIYGARATFIGGCQVLPVFWPTATTASRPAARWRIPGCRCSTASTRLQGLCRDLSGQLRIPRRYL